MKCGRGYHELGVMGGGMGVDRALGPKTMRTRNASGAKPSGRPCNPNSWGLRSPRINESFFCHGVGTAWLGPPHVCGHAHPDAHPPVHLGIASQSSILGNGPPGKQPGKQTPAKQSPWKQTPWETDPWETDPGKQTPGQIPAKRTHVHTCASHLGHF